MGSRFCLVFLLQLCLLGSRCPALEASVAHHRPHDYQSNAIPNHSLAENEHKLLIECQHADYRAYIKCLKREKRHQSNLGNQVSCLDQCFEVNCTTSSCLRDCHTHCKKRLIETYSKTVETSFDCSNGECAESKVPGVGNITTIVNVNNNMPNVTKCPDDTSPTNNGGGTGGGRGHNGGNGQTTTTTTTNTTSDGIVPKIDINNVINNQFSPGSGQHGGDCSYPGSNCYPFSPWQAMPQITIGIGGGQMGGCMFPMSWPCFQKYPAPPVDCSTCSNPFLSYRCDPVCNTDPRKNNTQTTTQRENPWGNINGRRP